MVCTYGNFRSQEEDPGLSKSAKRKLRSATYEMRRELLRKIGDDEDPAPDPGASSSAA